jgi:hypothetical protein
VIGLDAAHAIDARMRSSTIAIGVALVHAIDV